MVSVGQELGRPSPEAAPNAAGPSWPNRKYDNAMKAANRATGATAMQYDMPVLMEETIRECKEMKPVDIRKIKYELARAACKRVHGTPTIPEGFSPFSSENVEPTPLP